MRNCTGAPDQEMVLLELVLPKSVCTQVCVRTRIPLIRARSGQVEAPAHLSRVVAGLVPATSVIFARCQKLRGRRDKPGDDAGT